MFELNDLVNAVTAYRTWWELEADMAGGYVPTVLGRTEKHLTLVRLIRRAGYTVYTGR